jgi:hypothetical protein
MSTEPADEYLGKVASLESRLQSLYDDVRLNNVNDDLGQVDAWLHDLPAAIQQVRSRGYVFKNYLEKKAQVMAGQWDELRPRVTADLSGHAAELSIEADGARWHVSSLRETRDESRLASAESAVADLESRIGAARRALEGTYGPLKENTRQSTDQVKEIVWTLDQVDGATFKLYPGEGVISAVKAQWMTSEKEGSKGILYLTEERVLFEQKEEIATKKVLFIATEKQKVQGLKWESPLSQIESAQASEKGGAILGIGKKEILEFDFGSSVRVRSAILRLEADSDTWQALIGRVKSGDIAGERTVPKDKAAVEAARAAPTKCNVCGATITQPVVKGMTEVKCEYCGTVIRL